MYKNDKDAMINIKEGIKFGRKLFVLVGFLAIFFAINIQAMNVSQMQNKSRLAALKKKSEKLKETKKAIIGKIVKNLNLNSDEDDYFVHAIGTAQGEIISGQALRLSITFQNLLGVEPGNREIPIKDYSSGAVKILCDTLKNLLDDKEKKVDEGKKKIEEDMQKFRLKESVNLANMFTFFNVPDVTDILLKKIKIDIEDKQEDIDELAYLNPDLQKSLMVNPTIAYLKNLIIKAKESNKLAVAIGGDIDRKAVRAMMSPDGKKMLVIGGNGRLILWDISNLDHQKQYDLTNIFFKSTGDDLGFIDRMEFSQDNNKIFTSGHGGCMLWDIHNLEKITPITFGPIGGVVKSVAFSLDSKKIAMAFVYSYGPSVLLLSDITDLNRITTRSLSNKVLVSDIGTIAFSPDGGKIVIIYTLSSGYFEVVLFDITKLEYVRSYNLNYLNREIGEIVGINVSLDCKKIIVAYKYPQYERSSGPFGKIILYDINNLDKIIPLFTKDALDDDLDDVLSLKFSRDGKEVFFIYEEKNGCIFNSLNLLNINDLKDIDHQSLNIYPRRCILALCNSDGNKIVLRPPYAYGGDHLFLVTLLTDAQMKLINDIKHYNSDQIRLLYELCLRSFKNQEIQPNRLCELEKKSIRIITTVIG